MVIKTHVTSMVRAVEGGNECTSCIWVTSGYSPWSRVMLWHVCLLPWDLQLCCHLHFFAHSMLTPQHVASGVGLQLQNYFPRGSSQILGQILCNKVWGMQNLLSNYKNFKLAILLQHFTKVYNLRWILL